MVANAFSEMCDDIQSVLRKPDTTRIGKFEPYTSELRPDEPLAHTASRSKTTTAFGCQVIRHREADEPRPNDHNIGAFHGKIRS